MKDEKNSLEMNKKACVFKVILLSVLILTVHACFSNAFAYTVYGYTWPDSQATFYINTEYGPSGSFTEFRDALDTWSEVSYSSFEFIYGGTTTSHAFGTNDGVNITDFGSMTYYLGQCSYWYSGGSLVDADVRLNINYTWVTDGSGTTYGPYEVKTVAIHEYGHALGLGHSSNTEAIMYPIELGQKTLHQDDINGIRYLYPGTANKKPYLAAADLNVDGTDDLVYIEPGGYVYYTTDLSSWVRIGDSKFTTVVAGDFDSDGNEDDLAGINLNQYVVYTTDLSSWEKSGSNKFDSLISADLDNNGIKNDLAGINLNQYCVYTTVITADWTKSGANRFTSVLSFDGDGDGAEDDLAGINLNKYVVYTTDITSDWTKSGANKFTSVISADFTDSGTEGDLAGINFNQYVVYTTDINSDWTKSGANKFTTAVSADFDGNGNKDDLAGINLNQYVVYTTDINSDWTRIGLNRCTSVVCGDFDGDGAEDDLAAVNINYHVLYAIYTTEFSDWTKITKP